MAFRLPGQNRFKPNKARPRPPATSQPSQPLHESQNTPKPSSTIASVPPPLPTTKDTPSNAHNASDHMTTGASGQSSQMPDLTQATTQATQDTVIATPPRPSRPIDPAPGFDDSQSTHHPLDGGAATPGPSRPKQDQGEETRHAHLPRPSPSGRHPSSSAAHVEKGNFALTEKDKSPPYSPQPRSGLGGRGPMARISGSPAVRSRSLTPSTPLVNRGAGPSALLKAAAAHAESGFSRPSPGRIPSRKSRAGRSDSSRATSVAPSMPPADSIAPITEIAEVVVETPAMTETASTVEADNPPEAPPTPLRQQASREEMRARIQAKVLGTKMDRPSMSRENSWNFAPSGDRAAQNDPEPSQIQSISSVLAEASSATTSRGVASTGTTKQLEASTQVSRSEVASDAGPRRSPGPSTTGEANVANEMDIDDSEQEQSMRPSGIIDRNADADRATMPKPPTADGARLESVPNSRSARQATPLFLPERSPTPSLTIPQDAEASQVDEDSGPSASAQGQARTLHKDAPGGKKQSGTKAKSKKKSTQDHGEDAMTIDGREATVQKKKPRRKTGAAGTGEETDQLAADDMGGDNHSEMDDGQAGAPSGSKKGKKRKSVNRVRSELKKAKKTVQFTQAGIKDLVAGDTLGEEVLNVDDLTMADLAINITSGTISARGILLDDFTKATKKQAAEQLPYRRWSRWEKEQIYRRHVRRRANAERHNRRQAAAAKGLNPDEEVSPDEDDSEEEFEIVPDRFTPPPEDQQVERIQPLSLNPAGEEAAGNVEGEDAGQEASAEADLYDQYAEEEEVDEDNMDVNPEEVADFPLDEHDYEPTEEEDDAHGFNVVDDLPAEGTDYYAGLDRNGEEDDEGYAGAGDQYYEQFLDDPTQTYLDQREHARDEHRRRQENVEALYEDDNTKMVNSRTYSKVRKSERWTKTETNFFFDTALPEAGENPFMLQAYFPGRTHQQLKNKMNREYKANKDRYLAALDNKRRVDTVYLEKAAGFDSQKDYGDEIAWLAQLKEDAKKLAAEKPPAQDDEAMLETFDEEKEDEGVDKEEWGGEDGDGDGKHDPYEYPDYDNENYEEGEGETGETGEKGGIGGNGEDEEDIDIDPEEG